MYLYTLMEKIVKELIMSLLEAHKGYEYQDLFSAYHVLNSLLKNENVLVKIDQKEVYEDKFDDLTIITDEVVIKRQIKYSENKILEKKDLSSLNYDLALDVLYKSWASMRLDKQMDFRLCLAWEFISSEELNFLEETFIDNSYHDYDVRTFTINLERIWPKGSTPIASWKRLKNEVLDKGIDRDDFEKFLNDLTIELNLPKSNLSLEEPEPGSLEKLLFKNLRLFGVGKFPNNKKTVEDIALKLIYLIKISRAKGDALDLNTIIYNLGLIRNYGNINQTFSIDQTINVYTQSKYIKLYNSLNSTQKVSLIGAPGSGKSWFIQNFKQYLITKKVKIIEHYCYTGVNDSLEKDRITTNVFLGNLVNDILIAFPHLINKKPSLFGVDVEELQELLNNIEEDVVLIVDGLDHIGRIHSLHEETMVSFDTQIVKTIAELNFPENVKVLLASQPYDEVLNLEENDFTLFEIPLWTIEETKLFMDKNGLTDIDFNLNDLLSKLLYTKSSGNPLYLTYLINELNNYPLSMMSKEVIDKFPPYDNMLENYYTYLMSKIKENSLVPRILAGSPFSLSSEELKEITGEGDYVDFGLSTIRSILSFNSCSGGYIIYHESFRRFTLKLLEDKKLSVEKLIYNPLVDWLQEKGVYENKKAYLNLFMLLFESKRHEEILTYCNKDFVINSIYKGHSISSLKKNFQIIIKAAARDKNYEAIIKCTELNEMIRSFEDTFEENMDDYFLSLGVVNGFEYLKESLMFEGKTTLPYEQGLKVCYLCSVNNVVPEWEEYINKFIEHDKQIHLNNETRLAEEKLEFYEYYICAGFDMGKNLLNTIKKVSGKNLGAYRMIIINEYSRRNKLEDLQEILKNLEDNVYWIESIQEYLGEANVEYDKVPSMLSVLASSNTHSGEVLDGVTYFVNNIEWLVENHLDELELIKNNIKNKNWYFNWIIFVLEVNKVILRIKSGELNDSDLVKVYSLLLEDTEVYKGKPRTCDLLSYQQIIFDSLLAPLRYVKQKNVWRDILCQIERLSIETATSLAGSPSGPFPVYQLINLIIYIENDTNSEFVLEIMNNCSKVDNQEIVYGYLAEFSLKHTIMLANQNKESEAKEEFLKSTQFLLAYGYRKDRTLSRVIDSVNVIYKINEAEGINRLKKLKRLADNVVLRTDGRSTKQYPIEWFRSLADSDMDLAFEYLIYRLINSEINWRLEEKFEYFLEKLGNESEPIVENILYKTRPSKVNKNYLNGYLNNIESLIALNEESLAKKSIQDILNRIDSETEVDKMIFEKVMNISETLNIDYDFDTLLTKQEFNKNPYLINKSITKEEDLNENGAIPENNIFEHMSNEALIEFVTKNELNDNNLRAITQHFDTIEDFTLNTKMFIDSFVKHALNKTLSDREKIIDALSSVSSNPSIMAYLNMAIYLHHRDGWHKKFTETSYFVKAIEYNAEVAENYFFDYFYNEFSVGDLNFSAGDEIIKALAAISYDENEMINYWDSLFEIIEFRLPGRQDYNFDVERLDTENLNKIEKMIFLLLIRFKYGEAKRYRYLASGLSTLLSDENYRVHFIKPLNLFIDHHSKFLDYAMIIILSCVSKRFTKHEIIENDLIRILSKLDSTNNKVIDYLVKKITDKKTIRIPENYINSNEVIPRIVDRYLEGFVNSDSRVEKLSMVEVNIARRIFNEFRKIVTNKEHQEKTNSLVYDNSYKVYIENVYFYDILTKIIGDEIDNFLNYLTKLECETEDIEADLFETVFGEVDYIIANINSLKVRPKDIAQFDSIQGGVFDFDINLFSDEWCRVAYIERLYDKRKMHSGNPVSNLSTTTVISVVSFDDLVYLPITPLEGDYKIFDENLESEVFSIDYKESELITFNLNEDEDMLLNFKSNYYLGIRSDILNTLNIKLVDFGDGIKGVNSSGEVVIKYSTWEKYFRENHHGSYHIPYLKGADLQIEKNTFTKICELFENEPKMTTRKIKIPILEE